MKETNEVKMRPVMNAMQKAWIFRGRPSCNSLQREHHRSFSRKFYNLLPSVPFFNIIFATSMCFPASLPSLILPTFAPLTSKFCKAAPPRQPEEHCIFVSSPPLSLNCPSLSCEGALPKICLLFKQSWQRQASLHESSVIYCLINMVHRRIK